MSLNLKNVKRIPVKHLTVSIPIIDTASLLNLSISINQFESEAFSIFRTSSNDAMLKSINKINS